MVYPAEVGIGLFWVGVYIYVLFFFGNSRREGFKLNKASASESAKGEDALPKHVCSQTMLVSVHAIEHDEATE